MAEKCDECGKRVGLVMSFEFKGRKTPKRCDRCQAKLYQRIREAAKAPRERRRHDR